jgi:DNA-binding transcriptional regulator YiaG
MAGCLPIFGAQSRARAKCSIPRNGGWFPYPSTNSLRYPAPSAPHDIQKLRETNKVSQPVFARYLNSSESTVEKWETGAKCPSGMALKLLSLVEKHGLEVLA